MGSDRDLVCRWLEWVLAEADQTPADLARAIGVSHSTISRFLKPDAKHTLGLRTVAAICRATGLPGPSSVAPGAAPPPAATEDSAISPNRGRVARRKRLLAAFDRLSDSGQEAALHIFLGWTHALYPPDQKSTPREEGGRRGVGQ